MTHERCLECELSHAACDGDLAALQGVILDGADPGSESDCNTALFDAIGRGHLDILTALLDAGASLERRHPLTRTTPLMAALEAEQLEITRELHGRGAAPRSASLASLVSGGDRPELIQRLVSAGLDLNTADSETGRTALHIAATYGYLRTVNRLLEGGADVLARDQWGNTPATLARQNRHEDVAELLEGASVVSES